MAGHFPNRLLQLYAVWILPSILLFGKAKNQNFFALGQPNEPFLGFVVVNGANICNPCGIGGTVGNTTAVVQFSGIDTTCGRLATDPSTAPNLELCRTLQQSSLISNLCECTGNPADQSCPPCGTDVVTIPSTFLDFGFAAATCEQFENNQRIINPDRCLLFQLDLGTRQGCGCQPASPPTPPPTLRAPPAPTSAPVSAPTSVPLFAPTGDPTEPLSFLESIRFIFRIFFFG